ncbi:hypothetical protein IWW36_004142 [Coemansia brasiliensis]|uniref:RWD domain-containing protein n=1 Tax=Coemansia brasiliensis TaxID=2650707 RepID=A0A9W8I568_9FUNG|nr:hypothetical protein IWW36_004142 [Coemansia brasiliensis]
MDMNDNQQRQQDELVALEAIFGEQAVERCNVDGGESFVLHAPIDSMEAQVDLQFYFPESYPSNSPPIFEWIGARDTSAENRPPQSGFIYPNRQLVFTSTMTEYANREMHRMWSEDMGNDVVIYSWLTWLNEYLAERWPQPLNPIPLPKDGKAKDKSAIIDQPTIDISADQPDSTSAPAIFTGRALEMKKSVFVGHVAQVQTASQIQAVQSTLLQDKKIAQATHNIMAYRIRLENGSLSQDNDDDGETAAGKRLAHLLQLLNVENIMVVVTRCFG